MSWRSGVTAIDCSSGNFTQPGGNSFLDAFGRRAALFQSAWAEDEGQLMVVIWRRAVWVMRRPSRRTNVLGFTEGEGESTLRQTKELASISAF